MSLYSSIVGIKIDFFQVITCLACFIKWYEERKEDLILFLKEISMECYAGVLMDNGISSLRVLHVIRFGDFIKIGFPEDHAKK